MVKTKMIFVDDSFIIVLVLENDEFHKRAIDYEKR